ncbi:MAG TPA: toll/interleukin-1 receptor domain-containing protein [Aggregatilineaceae bacterium]|nr:toll/interleukin-1 receptor domain-containing protein [Aggregatilineaceae bacterium]
MPYICLLYASQDALFAEQLGIQLQQRGLVMETIPDPTVPADLLLPDHHQTAAAATHAIVLLSPSSLADESFQSDWQAALDTQKRIVVVMHETVPIPEPLRDLPLVDFRERFLLAVEELVKLLRKLHAPTRQLTIEYPPPVVKPQLMPVRLPSERCWREDRLRINYRLPILLPMEELELRLPAFFDRAGFDVTRITHKSITARRRRLYPWFDPRRADHTITVKRRTGSLRVYYRMTRTQVYHWLPSHYRTLDREAAALYRYLAGAEIDTALDHVQIQARTARVMSWASLLMMLLFLVAVIYLGVR